MKCSKCLAELPDNSLECVVCRCPIDSSNADGIEDSGDGREEDIFKPFSGFMQTISTEFLGKEKTFAARMP